MNDTVQDPIPTPSPGPVEGTAANWSRGIWEIFLYLQVLDVMSTLIGFSLGNTEASPFIRLMIRWGPIVGLVASKMIACGLAVLCVASGKTSMIRWINYWFAALVVWNLAVVMRVLNS